MVQTCCRFSRPYHWPMHRSDSKPNVFSTRWLVRSTPMVTGSCCGCRWAVVFRMSAGAVFLVFLEFSEGGNKIRSQSENNTRGEKLEGPFFIGSDYVIVSGSI